MPLFVSTNKGMRNIDFIRLHNKWKSLSTKVRRISNPDYTDKHDVEYLYEGYAVREAHSIIIELYQFAKDFGLTEEQRTLFFAIVRKHNDFTRGCLSYISNRINQLKEDDEYFDESELGAYAGYYSLGFDEYSSEIENLSKLYQSFNNCLFSIKGEHIVADKLQRITLKQTIQKWENVKNYIIDDTIMPYVTPSTDDLPF